MQNYTSPEIKLFKKLDSPKKIQDYLNKLKFNFEKRGETCYSPRFVIKNKTAHCMEGAMLAAAVLEFQGHKPLVMDLRSVKPHDDDHVVAVFKQFGCFGAISKTNHAVLRFRDPIYKTLRELALSYFHEYFLNKNGKKTLMSYSKPFSLKRFGTDWITSEKELFNIVEALDHSPHFPFVPKKNKKLVRAADKIERKAGSIIEWKK